MWNQLQGQIYLGSKAFIEKMQLGRLGKEKNANTTSRDWAHSSILRCTRHGVVSARLTTESALERNDLVAWLAKTIVIAHASAAGALSARCDLWVSHGLSVTKLTDL